MFTKNNKTQTAAKAPQPPVKPAPPSLISRDLKIIGDLKSDGEIQVDGSVDGDVRSKTLLIGESAHVKGEITADSVVVHGSVNGQIKAKSVRLAASAHMVGDILHEDLAIETGAFLEGHCRRIEDEASAAGPEKTVDDKKPLATGAAADKPAQSVPPPQAKAG